MTPSRSSIVDMDVSRMRRAQIDNILLEAARARGYERLARDAISAPGSDISLAIAMADSTQYRDALVAKYRELIESRKTA